MLTVSSTLSSSCPARATGRLNSKTCFSLPSRRHLRRDFNEASCVGRTRRFVSASIARAAAAAASNDDDTGHPERRDPALLRALLAEAVSSEDYSQASRLKRELEEADPSILLQLQLEQAVEEERYADAAGLKARLDALRPPPPPRFEPGPTTSDTVTEGIRVKVKSFFVASQSLAGSTFTFAYRIKITNETANKTFQLLSRAWEIVDGGDGTERNPERTERVRGPGVVGETPVLGPGRSFSYSSFAQLRTPAGSMRGAYTFVEVEGEDEDEGGEGVEEKEGKEKGKKTPPRQQQQRVRGATQNPRARAIGPEFDVAIGQFGLDERDSRPPEPGSM